jgi:glucokinase
METLGIDFGGSKLLACVVSDEGEVLAREHRETGRNTDPARALELVGDCVESLRARGLDFSRIGLGFPGLVDSKRGVVRSSVILDGWSDVALAHAIERRCGVPCMLDNDVNMAAICELALRAPQVPDSMVFVAVGTGIGGAICFGGRVHRGAHGIAGEIGNTSIDFRGRTCWCKRRGCLNTLASGHAIERELGHSLRDLSADELPDPLARAAHALGVGLANVINLLDPDLIVLGGGVSELGGRYFERVVEAVRSEAFSESAAECVIERSRGGYASGAVGAALASRTPGASLAPARTP